MSDNVISTLVSDVFLNDYIVAVFLFVHDFCLKATFFETCWASNPKCRGFFVWQRELLVLQTPTNQSKQEHLREKK